MSRYICVDGIETLIELEDAPSIDIVFCKDCKYRSYCCRGDIPVRDNGFCSDGERSV